MRGPLRLGQRLPSFPLHFSSCPVPPLPSLWENLETVASQAPESFMGCFHQNCLVAWITPVKSEKGAGDPLIGRTAVNRREAKVGAGVNNFPQASLPRNTSAGHLLLCFPGVFSSDKKGTGVGEFGVSRCKLLCREWMNNKVLLHSTGNYTITIFNIL